MAKFKENFFSLLYFLVKRMIHAATFLFLIKSIEATIASTGIRAIAGWRNSRKSPRLPRRRSATISVNLSINSAAVEAV